MSAQCDIRIDVSDALGLGVPAETAVWLFLPDNVGSDAVIIFAFPGGTYGREYYHLEVPNRSGYSFAEALTGAGYIVACCDHIGLGASSRHEPFSLLTKEKVIAADQATVRGVVDGLESGSLVDGVGPIHNFYAVGVGHSMGARLLALQQEQFSTFDAVALLGTSWVPRSGSDGTSFAPIAALPDPTRPPRALFHRFFYGEDVPSDLIAVDDSHAVRAFVWMFRPGEDGILEDPAVLEAAQKMAIPVFLGFGAQDTSPEPHVEAAAYHNSPDVTVFVLPGAAHCTNFASTRKMLFDRIAGWCQSLARTYV